MTWAVLGAAAALVFAAAPVAADEQEPLEMVDIMTGSEGNQVSVDSEAFPDPGFPSVGPQRGVASGCLVILTGGVCAQPCYGYKLSGAYLVMDLDATPYVELGYDGSPGAYGGHCGIVVKS